MGTYYLLANKTKKQKYEPAMGEGNNKYGGFIYFAEEIVRILMGPWQGNDVVLYSDDGYPDRFFEADGWPMVSTEGFVYDDKFKLNIDHNGVLKLMTLFVKSVGPEQVAVMLDKAIEAAAKEPE